ncbi:MAG: hypothetical protein HC887_03580 [Desulfobacteraceae bacterium]|nr:hypothetical protein [Desulfobacteraceae bacterium]
MTSSSISVRTDAEYNILRRRIILMALAVSIVPMMVICVAMYHHFTRLYHTKTEEHLAYRANTHAELVELF